METEGKGCAVCGKPFRPRDKRQILCGSPECRKIWDNRMRRERARAKGDSLGERACLVCGRAYYPRTGTQKTCGSEDCRRQWKLRKGREDRQRLAQERGPIQERACLVCGKTYIPRMRTQKTCGSEGCQRQWANRTSQLRGKQPRPPRAKPQVGKPCKLCGGIIGQWGCGEYCCQSCKTADGDGSARRELYPGTAGLIRKWHGEGMTPEAIAKLLARDLRQVKEVLDNA